MKKFLIVGALIATLLLLVFLSYWFVETNPLKFTREDVRDVMKQVFIYSFAGSVAIFGYWWTQKKQHEIHDEQLREARWNQTLDIQLKALQDLVTMRSELHSKLFKTSKWDLFWYVNDSEFRYKVDSQLEADLQKIADHISFYFSGDEFYLSNTQLELSYALLELGDYVEQVLPLPEDCPDSLEHEVAWAIKKHFNKALNLCLLIEWELWVIKHGEVLERHDIALRFGENKGSYLIDEEYMEWKLKEFLEERKMAGLTSTYYEMNKDCY